MVTSVVHREFGQIIHSAGWHVKHSSDGCGGVCKSPSLAEGCWFSSSSAVLESHQPCNEEMHSGTAAFQRLLPQRPDTSVPPPPLLSKFPFSHHSPLPLPRGAPPGPCMDYWLHRGQIVPHRGGEMLLIPQPVSTWESLGSLCCFNSMM